MQLSYYGVTVSQGEGFQRRKKYTEGVSCSNVIIVLVSTIFQLV